MIESTKKALYATVGAPVLTAKRVNEKFQEITTKFREADISKEFDAWAAEGEKLIDRFQPAIDDWSAKLDDADVPAQVSKLREQLDDMLDNWRKNFRPTENVVTVPVKDEAPVAKPATGKTAAEPKSASAQQGAAGTAVTTPPAEKNAAKKTTAKNSTAKNSTAKKTTAKNDAKKPATKKA